MAPPADPCTPVEGSTSVTTMMITLESLTRGATVRGVISDSEVTVVDVRWYGDAAVELTYKRTDGQVESRLLYRDDEPQLQVLEQGPRWSFSSEGLLFKLAAEARRIRLAHLFDPLLAVHTSLVEPLPHQITAVYGEMLPRQPLRFLLADDPGSGKTIMAGLLIKELMARGDVRRCMVICPGNLAEQWQDEMDRRFHLPFEILTNDNLASARRNWFAENDLVICRLDKMARDEDAQEQLAQTDWDLVVVDEAHKMSAHYFGHEVKYTKRHKLGQLLSGLTRHFLLMTATPHNGKEEDFQLFLSLIDGDRFVGRYRETAHGRTDASDLMRRMVKEDLVRFNGKPLFPERRAYTVEYELSGPEAALYRKVTEYVREEFNRADALEQGGRRGTVGFALTVLQRRLASSPEAIFKSLQRRRERLKERLRETELIRRGIQAGGTLDLPMRTLTEEDLEDLDEAPDEEVEAFEDEILDEATAARTIDELTAEIATLTELEKLADEVRRSGADRKWEELQKLLQAPIMFKENGSRRKLIIFTEHRDTLSYLTRRIRTLLGRPETVVTIRGGMSRVERREAEQAFLNDPDVEILVATDAAGEGINLQRAHLMVNYDLPWNPNRIEQRFGRIHRIGQEEVCHLWNLVAAETREGDVFLKLLKKIEVERAALGGAVFDVLGRTFQGTELRRLLVEAIRYGEQPEVRARLDQVVGERLDRKRLQELIEDEALAHDSMDATEVQRVRARMERAQARKLQPHMISAFFREAFHRLGGRIREREARRYEIDHIPSAIRDRDRRIGSGTPLPRRYERITFEKERVTVEGGPRAEFASPGHPLLDATIDLILERYRPFLKDGTVLVDPRDEGQDVRALFFLEHSVHDGTRTRSGGRRVISRRMQFVEVDSAGAVRDAGYAPYLDYEPLHDADRGALEEELEADWLTRDLEDEVMDHAVAHVAPRHLREVRDRRVELLEKTERAVHERLTKEIGYWDARAVALKEQEEAGRQPTMNSQRARQRCDELQERLRNRMKEIEEEKQISAASPVVVCGALIVPSGLLRRLKGEVGPDRSPDADARRAVELAAMRAVEDAERRLGYEPRDVSEQNLGYDIESQVPGAGELRFIEVKGRAEGARTVTVTKNEILTALNKPESFILALVLVSDGEGRELRYVREPFNREPDFNVTSVNYDLSELMNLGQEPS